MKDPSTSVLRDRFRRLAICHVGSVPVNSVAGQLHQDQHEQPNIWSRPCPQRRAVEIRYPIFDLTRNTNTGGERQTRRKVAALSRLLLFDDVGIHRCRARGATFQHLNRCPGWTGKDEPCWIMPPSVDASRASGSYRQLPQGLALNPRGHGGRQARSSLSSRTPAITLVGLTHLVWRINCSGRPQGRNSAAAALSLRKIA